MRRDPGHLQGLLEDRAARGQRIAAPPRAGHRGGPGAGAGLVRDDPGPRARRSPAGAGDVAGGDPALPRRDARRGRWRERSRPMARSVSADNLTILVALAAGLISFLSPCVLPLVPAYLGQLTAVAVAGSAVAADGGPAPRHPLAGVPPRVRLRRRVRGGLHAARRSRRRSPPAGPLAVDAGPPPGRRRDPRHPRAEPRGRPADARASSAPGGRSTPARRLRGAHDRDDVASARGAAPTFGDRLGGRLVGSRGGWLASFGLGAIFAVGWTPCIGVILGGILTMASTSTTVAQGAILLVAYTHRARAAVPRDRRSSTTGRRRSSGRWSATAARSSSSAGCSSSRSASR